MEERENISAELKSLAPTLIDLSKEMPYAMPEAYFDLLPVQMLSKITAPAKMDVPAGYFDALPSRILAKVKGQEVQQELESVAPLLNSIDKQMPYSVPTGYFENLQSPVVEQEERKEEVPVIPIQTKRRPWMMWAAAVVVVCIISLVTLQNRWNKPALPSVAEETSTDSATNELASQLQNIEDSAISSELTDGDAMSNLSAAVLYLETDNFENALRDLSDEEIKTQLVLHEVPLKKS